MLASGVGRLAWGVEGLALLFHVQEAADSFVAAGLAVGALGVTSAALAPVRGAIVDRRGREAMLVMALSTAAVIVAIALTPPVGPDALSYVALAGLAGIVPPPFTAWTRTGLARHLAGQGLARAYTIDNVLEESAFLLGPLLAGLAIAVATPAAALVLAAILIVLGAGALTIAPWAQRWAPPRRQRRRGPRAPLNRPLLLVFACLAGAGAGLGLVEVGVAAFALGEGSRASAGPILAALSAGGILGALLYGARAWGGSSGRQYAVLLALLGTGMAAMALPGSLAAMAVVSAIAGLAFTPVFIVNSLLIEELSPAGPTAAAFAGVSTAMNGGFTLGATLGGGLVEAQGTDPAFLAAGAVVIASAAAALALQPSGNSGDRARR